MALLKQPAYSPYPLPDMVVALWLGTSALSGAFDMRYLGIGFEEYKRVGEAKGFLVVASSPLTSPRLMRSARSSSPRISSGDHSSMARKSG